MTPVDAILTEFTGMPRGIGRLRQVIAALLALALLVLPSAPMRQASAALPHAQPTGQGPLHDCMGHGGEVAPDQALGRLHAAGGQADRQLEDRQMPGCCGSAQCPATLAVPPMAPAQPLAPSITRVAGLAPPPAPDGIGVAPPTQPPRALA
ncbi:hypothetical protein [Dankookia sp. P2]|uniref:hypothetical protein n=1 Tax=Dankookia sp. P2 TaxID=3423955 RepID=UPI003D66CE8B